MANVCANELQDPNDLVVVKRSTLIAIGEVLNRSLLYNEIVMVGTKEDATEEDVKKHDQAVLELEEHLPKWNEYAKLGKFFKKILM